MGFWRMVNGSVVVGVGVSVAVWAAVQYGGNSTADATPYALTVWQVAEGPPVDASIFRVVPDVAQQRPNSTSTLG